LAIAADPGGNELGHIAAMLDEGERGRAIIEVPAEAAVVEIDDLGHFALDHQIGKPHIAVDEAEALGSLAEGLKPEADEIDNPLKQQDLLVVQAHAGAP